MLEIERLDPQTVAPEMIGRGLTADVLKCDSKSQMV